MPDAVMGGHPLHWRVLGHGPRRAVMLHCSLAHGGAWSAVAARLGDALTMVVPDLPAHGRSGDWDASMGDYHDVLTRAIGALAGAGPVDLIGHSLGATVALRLALERPGMARSLTLVEPVLFAAIRGTPAYAEAAAEQAAIAASRLAGGAEAAAATFHARWGSGAKIDALPAAQRRYIVARIALIEATDPALYHDGAGMLAPGRLEALRCPVCLIDGDASPGIIGAVAGALAARLPDVRRVTVAGAGHMVPLTHPDEVAAAIRETLARSAPQDGQKAVDLGLGGRP
jgi:pimeloyl-ACP methyl ester carboxylesterase